MATSSFQKQFVIKENVDNFVKEMSKKVTLLDKDFDSKLLPVKI